MIHAEKIEALCVELKPVGDKQDNQHGEFGYSDRIIKMKVNDL